MSDDTLTSRSRIVEAKPEVVALRVVWPRALARRIALTGTMAVGRTDGLALGHATVSRQHAEVAFNARGPRVLVTDLGSHNGTFVGGNRLAARVQVEVAPGDSIRFGDVVLVLETGDSDLESADGLVPDIPGSSPSASRLRHELRRAAAEGSPALVIGPTGAGKERCAAALHRLSGRAGPLVTASCAELPRELIESQLFGHERASFTGATEARPGLFRAAHRGTLFLDEIGELPADLQPKLLRVIQEGEVRRLGATRPERVDVRLVAATNRVLRDEVEAGRFRRDLYARLAIWELLVPGVHERPGDVIELLDAVEAQAAAAAGRAPSQLDLEPAAIERLVAHLHPENLRGLERLVRRRAPSPGGSVGAPVTAAEIDAILGVSAETSEVRERPGAPSKDELSAALDAHGGSVRAVAAAFGRDRKQVYRWLERHGLRGKDEPG